MRLQPSTVRSWISQRNILKAATAGAVLAFLDEYEHGSTRPAA